LRYAPVEMRTVTYYRVIRLSEALFDALEVQPVPVVPELEPPEEQAAEGT
jgi:hypothetical protein